MKLAEAKRLALPATESFEMDYRALELHRWESSQYRDWIWVALVEGDMSPFKFSSEHKHATPSSLVNAVFHDLPLPYQLKLRNGLLMAISEWQESVQGLNCIEGLARLAIHTSNSEAFDGLFRHYEQLTLENPAGSYPTRSRILSCLAGFALHDKKMARRLCSLLDANPNHEFRKLLKRIPHPDVFREPAILGDESARLSTMPQVAKFIALTGIPIKKSSTHPMDQPRARQTRSL